MMTFNSTYHVDMKYINLMSSRLERFAWKKNNLATCRCPMCGDSKRNQAKTRFFFYQVKTSFFVKCHNCSYSTTFSKFLETQANELYQEYRVERFLDSGGTTKKVEEPILKMETPDFHSKNHILCNFPSIRDLEDSHYAKQYVKGRMIPEKYWNILYFAQKFSDVANELEESEKHPRDSRLVIPFFDQSGELFAIQGRALNPDSTLRYITIRDPESDLPKIYGLERYDASKKGYFIEGPIDSLFLENALAGAGAFLNLTGIDPNNTTFVYDNEPRNLEILKLMSEVIGLGRKICIWPENIQYKDVNEMVENGIENVQRIIDDNTFSGLTAQLKFTQWRKV